MKIKFLNIVSVFALTLLVFACNKKESEFGTTNVFMPQASMTSDGAKGTFMVPSYNNAKNHTVDTPAQKLIIPLSVMRSGTEAYSAYSVSIKANTDTIAKIIQSGTIANAVAIPAAEYQLASSATVPDGNAGVDFNLSVNMPYIRANYGKALLVAVEIQSPTKYNLNRGKSITIVNINTELLLGPDGRFDPSAYYYIRLHLNSSPNVLGIENNSDQDGALLQQQVKSATNFYQQWRVLAIGNRRFRLENRGSGKVVGPSFNRMAQYGWPDANNPWFGAAQRTKNEADTKQNWTLENVPNTQQFAIVNVGLGTNRQLFDVWGYDATVGKTNIALMGNRTLDGNDVFYFDKAN